jgi:hypothetical protein
MKSLLFSILFFSVAAGTAFSQGTFLGNGESGLGVSVGLTTSKDATGYGGSLGYSIGSIADFGVSVNRLSLIHKLDGSDLSDVAVSPSLTINFNRNSTAGPICASLSFGFEREAFSSVTLDDSSESMAGDYFSVGCTFYGNIHLSQTAYLQPSAEIGYITGTTDVRDRYRMYVGSNENSTGVIGLGAALVVNSSTTKAFVLEPAVVVQRGLTTFAISLSFVLGTSH